MGCAPNVRASASKTNVTAQSSILVGTSDRTVFVRVEGKGSFLNSTGLKEFTKEMINRGYRDFVIDLKNCPVMDSTFMGTLAGVALRLRELGQGQIRVVNLNERNFDLLGNLGLDQLFIMGGENGPAVSAKLPRVGPDEQGGAAGAPVKPLPSGPVDKGTQAQTMLDAHTELVEANPENAAKFKDVIEYLKQDLHLAR
jgi:anti-anti-sigma factor